MEGLFVMIEVINVTEPDVKYNEHVLCQLSNIIKEFIISAFKDVSFRNSNLDTKFKYIHEIARFFNPRIADRWYISWKKYWTHNFKNNWIHDTIEEVITTPFAVLEVDIKSVLQDIGYEDIMCKLYEIFPYMEDMEYYAEDEEEPAEEEQEDVQILGIENLIPRKNKLKLRYRKKDSYLYEIFDEAENIEPISIISNIKEIHNKRKGSIFFITMKVEIYDRERMTSERIAIHGYEEYDYIKLNHERFQIRNQFYKKCKYIVNELAEGDLQDFKYSLEEGETNPNEYNHMDVTEGGSLNFHKFIEFWKRL